MGNEETREYIRPNWVTEILDHYMPISKGDIMTDLQPEFVAYEVNLYNQERTTALSRVWFPGRDKVEAQKHGLEWEQHFGRGRVCISEMIWVGASSENHDTNPIDRRDVPIIDPNDPELREYVRLHQKFKHLHLGDGGTVGTGGSGGRSARSSEGGRGGS